MTLHFTIYTPVLLQYNLYAPDHRRPHFGPKLQWAIHCTNIDEDDVAELVKDTEKEKVVQQGLEIKAS